jgi:two-component system chemotaxis sensor kinase CheA
VHLVRNALDHGLETPADREAAGKAPVGKVRISARHAGGNVMITVADDGRGVDPHAVARKAVRAGLLTHEQADGIDMARAIELLFEPGFSTRDQADDISGRGVGMDAVRAKVRELGGEVLLTSEPGQGDGPDPPAADAGHHGGAARAGRRPRLRIALDRIDRTVRLADHPVRSAAGQRMLVVGDAVLPLYDAAAALGHDRAEDCEFAVIVQSQERSIALAVSALIGQRELVTRPLPADVAVLAPVSAAAVLSDGEIALLVDCDALMTDTLVPAPLRAA